VKLFLQAAHKTISESVPEIPSLLSLGVIVSALTIAVVAGLRQPTELPQPAKESAADSMSDSDSSTKVAASPSGT